MQSALGLGGVPKEKFLSTLYTAMQVARYGKIVLKFNGSRTAWVLENRIINKAYRSVGTISNGKAYNVTGEYVADYIDNQLLYSKEQYDSGEPIFIIQNDRNTRNIRLSQGYDLSYRFD